ncbi:serine/threonine protein kinase [Streptomyces yangpuensis]|uniref:non-specific serine/threonine protein kinase n=1 Tax=Streptomyces yangpuensis TaxID=1648182 RepID=A0ABY5PXC1_9ACTN|nr:serine/threonine-protein kinase [Streptomyces yangpuensis]MBZ9596932.1 serine/threonine protein kinase [Streptomyces erythrochromogenes]UUY48761.1 serine/threonine protein kinase [Streptomyces yangpuensis]
MGEVFAGRYELIDPIGRGGAGAVWRAWDHRRRRYVAAKVLLQSDAHTLLRFVREQALRIDHPHVLAPASWAADDDKVLFTMDLVGGGSLGHVIGDYGPLPPRFVCTLLDQLLSGLAAVHAEGVVHRDIKPANILMEATGSGRPHLRLSDFGISMRKGEPRLTETDYVVGTPGYFAPEQLMGAEPDFAADLFAVGLVSLYLLQGSKPDSRALVDHFLAHGTPDAPQGVPAPLWDVIANLLQPDPQNRFRTATGARKALAAAVELLPAPAPDEDPVEVFDQLGPLPPGFGPEGPEGPKGGAPSTLPSTLPSAAPSASATAVAATPQAPAVADPRSAAATVPVVPQQAAATAEAPAHVPAYGASYGPAYGSSETGSFHLPPPAVPAAPGAPAAAVPARGGIAPPPAKAVASLLAAALVCFAVGVWALTQM